MRTFIFDVLMWFGVVAPAVVGFCFVFGLPR